MKDYIPPSKRFSPPPYGYVPPSGPSAPVIDMRATCEEVADAEEDIHAAVREHAVALLGHSYAETVRYYDRLAAVYIADVLSGNSRLDQQVTERAGNDWLPSWCELW